MTKVGNMVFWDHVFEETQLCTPGPVQPMLMQLT